MTDFIKYPKIGQLKDAHRKVKDRAQYTGKDKDGNTTYDRLLPLPTLTFSGSVKLHGTNASVRFDRKEDGMEVSYGSRERFISLEKDNYGFVAWCEENEIAEQLYSRVDQSMDTVIFFGEFCGKGIQSKVGICELKKMFVTFGMLTKDESHSKLHSLGLRAYNEDGVTQIEDQALIQIDLNDFRHATQRIFDITHSIEAECPVAKRFGIDGGIGEGIVFKCIDDGYEDIMFKSKGEKHSNSRVKTLSPVDIDRYSDMQKLCNTLITDERLNKGLEYLAEMGYELSKKSTGLFLGYFVKDLLIEESIAIEESGFDSKALNRELSIVAKNWYFKVLADL